MVTLEQFPDEILIHIFKRVSGHSLAISQTVCRRWSTILEELLGDNKLWKSCCLKEISEDILFDISGCQCITDIDDIYDSYNPVKWKILYVTWFRSRHIKDWPKIHTEIRCSKERSRVYSVRINGDFLFTGCNDCGDVSIWNHLTGNLLEVICIPGKTACAVLNILFLHQKKYIQSEDDGVCDTHFDMFKDVKLANINLPFHACLICYHMGGVFTDIYNCLQAPKDFRRQFICIRGKYANFSVFGNTVIMASADHIVSGHRVIELSPERMKPRVKYKLYGHTQHPSLVKIWKNKVVSVSSDNDLLMWDITNIPDIDDPSHTLQRNDGFDAKSPDCSHIFLKKFDEIVTNVIFRGDLIISITVSGLLYISTNGLDFTEYNIWKILEARAVAAALWGSIFVMATSSGKIYLYHMVSYSDFETFDPACPVVSELITTEQISTIDIGDDGDGPMIAVGTTDGMVTIIRWFNG